MINFSFFKKYMVWSMGFVCLCLSLLLVMCSTFPKRNLSFEDDIRLFVEAAIPGSELELFNGRDLSGWAVKGLGRWYVEDGVLINQRGLGYLYTHYDHFSDFILTCETRVSEKGNSGIYFRSKHPGWGFRPWPVGYEAQIDNHDKKNYTGSLYDRVLASDLLARDNEWFEMRIEAIGSKITIAVNDQTVVSATDPDYRKGFIALQAHGPLNTVEFKNIRLKIPD